VEQKEKKIRRTYLGVEDIARRFAVGRPGFKLVAAREVGLPLWELPIELLVVEKRDVPPLEEFVLRAVDAGLGSAEQAVGFLGIGERVGAAVVAGLVEDNFLNAAIPSADGEETALVLTPMGRQVIDSCKISVPETRSFELYYDGLTRQLFWPETRLDEPRDLQKLGVLEIPAFPFKAPEFDEIAAKDVDRLFREVSAGRSEEARMDVLAVRGYGGRRRQLFQRGVALAYRSLDSGDVEIDFFLYGRPAEEHSRAFAAAEGKRKLGMVSALREGPQGAVAQVLGEEKAVELASAADVAESVHRMAQLRDEAAELSLTASAEGDGAREQLRQLTREIGQIEGDLSDMPARIVEVYEHPEILRKAIRDASSRLLLVSPWVRKAVVTREFARTLEEALDRGVRIFVGYGISEDKEFAKNDEQAVQRLEELAERNDNFSLGLLGNTHAKVLAVDDSFAVIGSFNWLSFRGDPSMGFRDERSFLVRDAEIVGQLFEQYGVQIGASADNSCADEDSRQ